MSPLDGVQGQQTAAPVGAITGGTLGSVAIIIICCVGSFLFHKKRLKSKRVKTPKEEGRGAGRPSVMRKRSTYSQFNDDQLEMTSATNVAQGGRKRGTCVGVKMGGSTTPPPPPPMPPPPPTALPPGWEKHQDKASGEPYYFNVDTGESSWDRPC